MTGFPQEIIDMTPVHYWRQYIDSGFLSRLLKVKLQGINHRICFFLSQTIEFQLLLHPSALACIIAVLFVANRQYKSRKIALDCMKTTHSIVHSRQSKAKLGLQARYCHFMMNRYIQCTYSEHMKTSFDWFPTQWNLTFTLMLLALLVQCIACLILF